jgi:hypothetical protein
MNHQLTRSEKLTYIPILMVQYIGSTSTDTGCGFLNTLRGHQDLREETHFAAIVTALKPLVSCNRDLGIRRDSTNEGVGLTTVCRIAERAHGRTLIVSGDSFYR